MIMADFVKLKDGENKDFLVDANKILSAYQKGSVCFIHTAGAGGCTTALSKDYEFEDLCFQLGYRDALPKPKPVEPQQEEDEINLDDVELRLWEDYGYCDVDFYDQDFIDNEDNLCFMKVGDGWRGSGARYITKNMARMLLDKGVEHEYVTLKHDLGSYAYKDYVILLFSVK